MSAFFGLRNAVPTNVKKVRRLSDFPDPVGDEIILNKNYELLQTVDIGSDSIRIADGGSLRGYANGGMIMSTNTNGVVRATNLSSALVMREFNILGLAGPCLNLTGTIDHQLNLFFMGFLGASVGTVTGFDIQAFKDCYFQTSDGIVNAGTSRKIFYSQCPFYGITAGNAAITLDSTLSVDRIDMVNNFFKHSATGMPLRAEAGYNVGYGRVSGTMLEGPAVMLEGLSETDNNWWFQENDKVRNSRVVAQSYLTAPATTIISSQDTFTPVTGPFTVTALTQRFSLSGSNELVYIGVDPVLVSFNAAFSVDPNSADRLAFRATKNEIPLDYSQTIVEQGLGAGSSPRSGAVVALIEIEPGDMLGLSVSNLTSAGNVPWLNATYAVTT